MSDSLSNKELVAVGHQFAKAMSSDTPIIDMAKIVSRLAERLDCTTAALLVTQDQRDQMAVENTGLKNFIISDCHVAHIEPETFYEEEVTRYVSADGYEPETPAADAFLAEVRASAVEEFVRMADYSESVVDGEVVVTSSSVFTAGHEFAAQLRQGGAV